MILAIVLAVSFVPLAPRTAVAEQDSATDTLIAQMLASGDYVEGEAVAIARSHANLEAAPQAQQLAEVGTDAVQAAAQTTEAKNAAGDEAALRVQSAQEDTLDVKLVVDHNRTTEQILRDLYADPDVISAEPNYITTELEAFGGETDADQVAASLTPGTVQGENLAAQADANGNPEDLTSLQWAMDSSLSTDANANTPISPTAGYSMNVPGWKDGRTNADAAANASGTVCVMDTGIDADHPDLKNVLYQFTDEQQKKYNCGPYGYNASGDPLGTKYLRASGVHGTHVAGILAAQWNGQGVSGVAHGVKLISVSVFGGDGTHMTMSSVVKGFQFLVNISKETNLKVVNCSWGIKQPQFAIVAMVRELGKKGVNTIIAAGNDHENLDETIDFSSQTVSIPYAITVDSAMANGKTSEFSSYGQTSTEVFAPGSNHMSTIPTVMTAEVNSETDAKSVYSRIIRYFPQATAAENRIAYETFEDTSGVKVFNENPALNSNAKELPTSPGSVGYGDQHSLAVNLSSMNKQEWDMKYLHGFTALSGYVYLVIPVKSAADANNVKWASVNVAMSDAFKPEGSLDTLTCIGPDGKPVEVDTARYDIAKNEWTRHALPAGYTIDGAAYEGNINTMIRGSFVAYRGSLYLLGNCDMEGDSTTKLWRYDLAKDSWEAIDVTPPGGNPALCVLGDDLFFVGGMYTWKFENAEKACAARIDVDKKTVTPVNAKTAEQASQLQSGYSITTASANNIYLYHLANDGVSPLALHLYRLTYDKTANTMSFEDLTSAFAEVAPPIEQSAEEGGKRAHLRSRDCPTVWRSSARA